jgi:hypothetical protein
MKRRDLLLVGATAGVGALSGLASVWANGRARAFVFVPSDEKSMNIEKSLVGATSSLEFTVFGRAKDLEQSVRQSNPEVVIAPEPTLRDLSLSPTIYGKRAGSTTEPYVLITVDQPAAPKSMQPHTVGVLGIMDHSSMKRHCGELLGTVDQKIKTVTKYADLLPLLQFKVAQGVILPKRFSSALTSRSALKLISNEIPEGRVGLTSVAIQSQQVKTSVIDQLKKLNGGAMAALGVEDWQ